jgi:hypothetical protein
VPSNSSFWRWARPEPTRTIPPVGPPSPRHLQDPHDHRTSAIDRILIAIGVDFPGDHRHPGALPFAGAALVSVRGSLAADALLVAAGTAVFPATKGYTHFRFSDYGKLTAIGVVIACVAWPVVIWVSSTARRLFFRLAIAVTLLLWLPDVWILYQGQPARAVGILILMHLAIALVTYNALVRLAPPRRPSV